MTRLPVVCDDSVRPYGMPSRYRESVGFSAAASPGVCAQDAPVSGKPWTSQDVSQLKREIRQNSPTRVMGLHLGRSPEAVQQKANELGLSTKPTNQRPYGTGRKRSGPPHGLAPERRRPPP